MFVIYLYICVVDVEDIKFVINYDYPNTSEDYIHRIGRTGRVTQSGTAITFFTPDKQRQAKDLIAVLKEANQSVNPHLLDLARLAKNSVPSRFLPPVFVSRFAKETTNFV